MQIYVCVKHVPDSAASIRIQDKNKIDKTVTFLLNPYDEHAVTEAARIKDDTPGAQLIAVCLGDEDAEKTVRSALAMGADRGILIKTEENCDSILTARVLKAAIDNDGSPGLILTGKESIDCEGMQTMFRLAELFGFPCATNVAQVDIDAKKVRAICEMQGGETQGYEMTLPCVLGAGRGLNTPRYPTFPDVVKARKKPVAIIEMKELSFEKPQASMEIVELEPLTRERSAKELTGTPTQIAGQIIRVLKEEAKVL